MKDMIFTSEPQQAIENMSLPALQAHKDALLEQIDAQCSEEDALWGQVARVNAYIRAASKSGRVS